MKNITTIQVDKETRRKLKLKKLELQAKLKRTLSMDEYLQYLVDRSEQK
jgi:hypothetical protein